MIAEPKSKLYPGAIEHRLLGSSFLERMCARVHYEMILKVYGKPKWYEYLGLQDEDRLYMVETAKAVLTELDVIESKEKARRSTY